MKFLLSMPRSVVSVIGLIVHFAFLLIFVDVVEARGADLVISHKRQIAARAAKLLTDKFSIDDLPDCILVTFFTDVLSGLLARHERAALTCGTSIHPDLIVPALEKASLLLRLTQLRFCSKTFALRLL